MTQHIRIRHEIAEYKQWKSQFYAHEKEHSSHTIKYPHVLFNKANQNNVSDLPKGKDSKRSHEHPTIM